MNSSALDGLQYGQRMQLPGPARQQRSWCRQRSGQCRYSAALARRNCGSSSTSWTHDHVARLTHHMSLRPPSISDRHLRLAFHVLRRLAFIVGQSRDSLFDLHRRFVPVTYVRSHCCPHLAAACGQLGVKATARRASQTSNLVHFKFCTRVGYVKS